MQAAFARDQPRLANTVVLARLSMSGRARLLLTRPPVGEVGEVGGCADVAVAVEASSMSSRRRGQRNPSMGIGR